MPVAFAAGFDEEGKFHTFFEWLVNTLELWNSGVGRLVPGEDALGHRFVERQRQGQDL